MFWRPELVDDKKADYRDSQDIQDVEQEGRHCAESIRIHWFRLPFEPFVDGARP